MHVACFAFFLLQMSLLINSRLHPEETISSTEQKRLSEIPFPVVFRICIKPAFNQEALQEAGYLSSWHYFAGLYVFFFSFFSQPQAAASILAKPSVGPVTPRTAMCFPVSKVRILFSLIFCSENFLRPLGKGGVRFPFSAEEYFCFWNPDNGKV